MDDITLYIFEIVIICNSNSISV